MNKSEAADLLAFCAGFDKRKIGSADVDAWALAMSAVDEDEAREAVILHYRESTDMIKPADIMRIIRRETARQAPPELPQSEPPDPGVASRGRAAVQAAQLSGHAANLARKTRVLGFRDLAARLTQPPLSFPRAEMWNGYVPPRDDQDVIPELLHSGGLIGRGRPNERHKRTVSRRVNESPRRSALVAICSEAMKREKQDQVRTAAAQAEDDEW